MVLTIKMDLGLLDNEAVFRPNVVVAFVVVVAADLVVVFIAW